MSKADKKGRHHLHIELTPTQYRLLSVQAKSCGLSKRAYLVRLIEGNPVRARPPQEIKELRWEVHKIGVNINQIAHKVNSKDAVSKTDMNEIKDKIDIIWNLIKAKFYQMP